MTAILPSGWRSDPTSAANTLAVLRAAQNRRNPPPSFESPAALAVALDPTTVTTPALSLIDDALIRVERGETKRLIISMPPQEGKSERVTHYGVLWMLHRNPRLRICLVSYGDMVSRRFSYRIRSDIMLYNGTNGLADLGLQLKRDAKAASSWELVYPSENTMYSIGIGGGLTSRPVDIMFIDDPVKDFRAADSDLQSEQGWEWWQSVARPRLAPSAPVVLILTRWHESDLAGRLLAKQKEDEASDAVDYDRWEVINIPAQADHDPEAGETDPLGREPGEFMLSARGRTVEQWRATKNATSARIWSALYQGRPSPDSGDVWKRQWWQRYETKLWKTADGVAFIVDCDEMIQSWDMTFKDTKSSDYVVGQVWARRGANVYLLDQVRARLTFTETVGSLVAMHKKWPQARAILVEDKANGTAVIDVLRSKVPGIIPINPHESKYARASAVSPYIEACNVWLPSTEIQLFPAEDLIEEAAAFPNGAHDDQVDAASQALTRLFIGGAGAAAWLALITSRGVIETITESEHVMSPDELRQADFAAQYRE